MPLAITFWDVFFLLLIFLPLAMIWAFALLDIFSATTWRAAGRRSGCSASSSSRSSGRSSTSCSAAPACVAEKAAVDAGSDTKYMLQTLSDLHDAGKLSDEEFAAEKARVLGI